VGVLCKPKEEELNKYFTLNGSERIENSELEAPRKRQAKAKAT